MVFQSLTYVGYRWKCAEEVWCVRTGGNDRTPPGHVHATTQCTPKPKSAHQMYIVITPQQRFQLASNLNTSLLISMRHFISTIRSYQDTLGVEVPAGDAKARFG